MADLVRIAVVFLVILILLRRKIGIGLVMTLGACSLLILYRMPVFSMITAAKETLLNPVTIKLILALSFIRMLEAILREHAVLAAMMNASRSLLRNKKLIAVSMPLLIGLMPSVGGAYFSAPMVAETTRDAGISAEEQAFINYWFRHPWEYILPLYPGVLLAAAISRIGLYDLILVNLSYAILMIIGGFIFSMKPLAGGNEKKTSLSGKEFLSFLPIAAILLAVMIFRVELHYSLICGVVLLMVFYKYRPERIWKTVRHGFSFDVIILILGVVLFKEVMENSGAVSNLSRFFLEEGIPVSPILFGLPFITGLLTGITVGFVGSTFPLLISIAGSISPAEISFAFAGGFLGVLLSPVHVCLILTREYFKADMWGIYRIMIPGCTVIFIGAIVQYLILVRP